MSALPERLFTGPHNPIPVWERPEVADAQLVLVRAQLDADARGKPPAPFAAFHRAMKFLTARAGEWFSMLDVGCGVGHYGNLIARKCPTISYHGTDVSAAMIEHAIRLFYGGFPQLSEDAEPFEVCRFEDNAFATFDVVFVSQAVEMTDHPFASLRLVLAQAKKYVLLHRLRLTANDEPTKRIEEATYCGYAARNVLWNRGEMMEIAREYGEVIYQDEWDGMLTMIVEKG